MIRTNASGSRAPLDHAHSDGVAKASLKKNPSAKPEAGAEAPPSDRPGTRQNRHGEEIPLHGAETRVRPGPDGNGAPPVSLQTSPRAFEAGMLDPSQRFPRGKFEEKIPAPPRKAGAEPARSGGGEANGDAAPPASRRGGEISDTMMQRTLGTMRTNHFNPPPSPEAAPTTPWIQPGPTVHRPAQPREPSLSGLSDSTELESKVDAGPPWRNHTLESTRHEREAIRREANQTTFDPPA